MTRRFRIHTVRREGVWVNELEGEGRVPGDHREKDEAREAGREIAHAIHAEHVIHNIDGSIAARLDPDD